MRAARLRPCPQAALYAPARRRTRRRTGYCRRSWAQALLAVDAVSTPGTALNTTTVTYSHTVTAATVLGKAIYVIVHHRHSTTLRTVSSVTYNAVACTQLGASISTDAADFMGVEIWRLPSPSTGANNVVVTMSGACDIVSGAISFTGVDLLNMNEAADDNNGNAAIGAVTVASKAGQIMIGAFSGATDGTVTVNASETERYNTASSTAGQKVRAGMSTKPGANSTVTTSWDRGTPEEFAVCAVSVRSSLGIVVPSRASRNVNLRR